MLKTRMLAAALAAAALALPVAAAPAAAQATDTIHACYVPVTGNIYRIMTPNTQSSCFNANHVQFQWLSPDLNIGNGNLLRLRSGSPLSDRFVVDSAGGVVASGQLGIGVIPVSGAGFRMMWYPFKAAFRAGEADGTDWDDASIGFFSWAGGTSTVASGLGSFAFGSGGSATGTNSVSLGNNAAASGTASFAAGSNTRASAFGSTAMGVNTSAAGQGAVALGSRTTANADYAVALGQRASAAARTGAFVFGDASTTDSILASANNQFSVRAAGGYRLFSNATLTTGVSLNAGGSAWNVVSDRNRKENFLEVDGEDLLARVRAIPVSTWNYIAEGRQVRHMGPMAQDWHRAFGFNDDDRTINSGDFDGVNFAAVKALEARTDELRRKAAEADALRADVESLRQSNAALERRLAELESLVRSALPKP